MACGILSASFGKGTAPLFRNHNWVVAQRTLADEHIEWRFITERASWCGGHDERLVRSVKVALTKVLGRSRADTEELRTVLCEIEARINDRPLMIVSDRADDDLALTPAHFLIGRELSALPDRDHHGRPVRGDSRSLTLLHRRWRYQRKMVEHLWSPRGKWKQLQQQPRVGDIVLVAEQNLPRSQWALGRITELQDGIDGVARSARVKISNGLITRSVRSLILVEPAQSSMLGSTIVRAGDDDPVAVETCLGWVICGPQTASQIPSPTVAADKSADTECDQLLRKFCELEAIGIFSEEEQSLSGLEREEFERNLSFDGVRYTVRLLWKRNCSTLPNNYLVAQKRLDLAGSFSKPLFRNHNWVVAQRTLADEHIEWRFINERAPWCRGHNERLVRSVKVALTKVLGRSRADTEELRTVLCEIEARINDRPLTIVSDRADDDLALTPAHFLIGRELSALPDRYHHGRPVRGDSRSLTLLHRSWRYQRNMMEHLWSRWKREYLVTLSAHGKWRQLQQQVRVGDIVLVAEQNLPRSQWALRRITELQDGIDGVARSARVKISNGMITISVRSLILVEPAQSS
ncbi:hypothetical protein T08_15317 [Trichinella sp. T8]|nr:hypothetical protein T08_15317 [Trichinella sp. T8]